MSELGLGRREPTDFSHVEKYPLRALAEAERPKLAPVVIGVNWYASFDQPVRIGGRFWIGRSPSLGRLRGGHCVVVPPKGFREPLDWWGWHDQVSEGICVSEGIARAMALLNRQRYQPRPLYDWAQAHDEWPGAEPAYAGTSVRAGLDCARTQGMVPALHGEPQFLKKGEVTRPFEPGAGIAANRWATTTDEALYALGHEGDNAVAFLNSWGRKYPRVTWMPVGVFDRLRSEDGEVGLVTDR